MNQGSGVAGRGAYASIALAAFFAVGWAQWAASGLTGVASITTRVISVVLGTILVVWAVRQGRRASPTSRSFFTSRPYRVVVVVEAVLLVAGGAVLGALGLTSFMAVWVAFVVGIHFIAFGHFFERSFFWVGGAILAASAVGLLVGLAGLGAGAVVAGTGLIAAVVLFIAASRRPLQQLFTKAAKPS
jgi:hypothetical protein